jgi:hypothetical protein
MFTTHLWILVTDLSLDHHISSSCLQPSSIACILLGLFLQGLTQVFPYLVTDLHLKRGYRYSIHIDRDAAASALVCTATLRDQVSFPWRVMYKASSTSYLPNTQ